MMKTSHFYQQPRRLDYAHVKIMVHAHRVVYFFYLDGEDVRRCPCPMFKIQKFPVEELNCRKTPTERYNSWELDCAHT